MSDINYTISTSGATTTHSITWTVEEFLKVLENKTTRELRADKSMDSKVDSSEFGFYLKMQFVGCDNDIIEIYFMSPKSVYVKSSLTILLYTSADRVVLTRDYEPVQANKWQHLLNILKNNINNNRSQYINESFGSNKSFRIKFDLIVSNEFIVDFSYVPEPQLNNDLENLFNNGLFSDVTMTSSEGVEYKVHKALLASRSAVLKAHFEHNTSECLTNTIKCSFEKEVLRETLIYIYSDKAPKVEDIPEKLLAAADYYQLDRLKSLCEEALQKKLTVENAIETLQLADLHSANDLKQSTLKFIKDGQARLITETDGWTKLESTKLLKRIYEFVTAVEVDVVEPKCKLSKYV